MADNNKTQAQSKLGELFVDLGSTGAGNLIKSLNTVSASFLMTKNAATQALKPIIKMSQDSAGTVTQLDKLSTVTGLSIENLYKLKKQAELSNVSFDALAGQIQNLQKNLQEFQLHGTGNIEGYTLLGLNPRELDFREPLAVLDKIYERARQIKEPATVALAFDELGLSRELIYFKEQNKQLDKRLELNNENIAQLKKQQDAWNNLKVTWSAGVDKLMGSLPIINTTLERTTQLLFKLGENFKFVKEVGMPALQGLLGILKDIATTTAKVILNIVTLGNKNVQEAIKGAVRDKYQADKEYTEEARSKAYYHRQGIISRANYLAYRGKNPNYKKNYREWQKDMGLQRADFSGEKVKPPKITKPRNERLLQNMDVIPESELKPSAPSPDEILPPLPATAGNVSNNNTNNTIYLTQNITTNDAKEAAQLSFDYIEDELLERNNMSGR